MPRGIWKYAVLMTLLTSTVISSPVEAATKQEKQVTTDFTKYKTGMTITEFAKVRYGKTYKTQLTKKHGRIILKEKSPKRDSDSLMDYRYYFVGDEKSEVPEHLMTFFFTVKPKDKVYRLALKSLDFSAKNPMQVRQSDKQLKSGKRLKFGMTEQQLDNVLSGKGLGDWMNWTINDFSHTLSERDMERTGLGQGKGKTYIFRTSNPNKRLRVEMMYDPNEKTYRINHYETISSNFVISL